MPFVHVTRASGSLDCIVFCQKVCKDLPRIIAEALHIEDDPRGHLTPGHTTVCFRVADVSDINAAFVSIEVRASDFPTRRENIQERTEKILEALRKHPEMPKTLVGTNTISVWVTLMPSGYGSV